MADETSSSSSRYGLREACKTPSRYRDSGTPLTFRGNIRSPIKHTPVKKQRPHNHQQKRNEASLDHHTSFYSGENNVNQMEVEKILEPYETIEISAILHENLRRLKNQLNSSLARRFVFCEFFYSGVDQQLFFENDFVLLMKEYFPNLKTRKLRKPEWREIRRLMGKPRRCSQAFFDEEHQSLEAKRQKIRSIYGGSCIVVDQEVLDLPMYLPKQLIVGQRIFVRVREPSEGIYAATIDAIIDGRYRVVFEKSSILPCYVKDDEIMYDQPPEMITVSNFIEANRMASARGLFPSTQFYHATTAFVTPQTSQDKQIIAARDEKVGNFPARMLVILVKLCKLVEYKKQLIGNLMWMNDNAEKMSLLSNEYPEEFRLKYAQIVIDLETINRLFKTYTAALHTYYMQLLPHLNQPHQSDQPDLLRRMCFTHANQIVKHSNNSLEAGMKNSHSLTLITHLVSLLKQLRSLGVDSQNRHMSKFESSILTDTIRQIKDHVTPENANRFQDCVEVHIKHVITMSTKPSK